MADDLAIEELQRKIQREKALVRATMTMRQATNNTEITDKLDAELSSIRRNIDYFETTIAQLQERKMGNSMNQMSMHDSIAPSPPSLPYPDHVSPLRSANPAADTYQDPGGYGDPGQGGYSMGGGQGLMPPRGPYAPQDPSHAMPKGRPAYSRLGATLQSILLHHNH